jgi:hypothetical protein
MQQLNSFDAEWRLLVAATRNVDGRHFAGRLPPVGDNLQRIRPAISPPAATSGVSEDVLHAFEAKDECREMPLHRVQSRVPEPPAALTKNGSAV